MPKFSLPKTLLIIPFVLIVNKVNCWGDSDVSNKYEESDKNLRIYYNLKINQNEALGKSMGNEDETHLNWNYKDQHFWASGNTQCGYSRQSPINIDSYNVIVRVASTCIDWFGYNYSHPEMRFVNSGHTVNADAVWKNGKVPLVSGGPLPTKYKLAHIHWHWGENSSMGSEHTVDNKHYAMEMHLVHYSTKFSDLAEAVQSNEVNALAVIAILYQTTNDRPNEGISHIVDEVKHFLKTGESPKDVELPLDKMGLGFHSNYYSYLGSLTTPPCNQIVRWIVSKKILRITPEQLSVFRLLPSSDHHPLLDNFRQTQKTNIRVIFDINSCANEH